MRKRCVGRRSHPWLRRLAPALALSMLAAAAPALAQVDAPAEAAPSEWWSLHAQSTFIDQYHPSFPSPFRGANSLDPGNRGDETSTSTLFAGLRLWDGLAFYANPEIDQGFGLSDTLGIAGFPNGEGSKVGAAEPYVELPRAFFRYSLGLGGAKETIAPDANQLGGTRDADNLTFTFGKFSVVDIFDANSYAHDPAADFLNWAVIDSAAFDYAANAWGYTYGGAAEWTQSWWTLRAGLFDLSRVPNQKALVRGFGEFEAVAEAEERHALWGNPGKLKLLVFANRGRMGDYTDALRLGEETGTTPNVALVRRYNTRPGAALNLEQQIAEGVGAFARASLNEGDKEAYEYTDVNRSLAVGLSVDGGRWNRPDDTVGLAGVVDDISKDARAYFAAGGLGILVGDGQLPRFGFEKIIEVYYNFAVIDGIRFTLDNQYVVDPAYDAARGPVEIIGYRIHAEF